MWCATSTVVVVHLVLPTALAIVVLRAIDAAGRRRLIRSILLGFATGRPRHAGLPPHVGDEVRFVLIGGKGIGTRTLLRLAFIHMSFGVGVLAIAGSALWRTGTRHKSRLVRSGLPASVRGQR